MMIRPVIDADKLLIESLIYGDADHAAKKMSAEFFFPAGEKLSMCFEDKDGPVLFVRLDAEPPECIRMHVQFDCRPFMARRTIKMLTEGFPLVRQKCQTAKAKRLVFESTSASLRAFCEKHLGFQPVSGTADMEIVL